MFLADLTTADNFNIVLSVLFLILSYLIGSIPFGLVIGKVFCGKDIREYGSKNIGTTNSIRVLGKKVGYLVFLCDTLKGMLVILLVRLLVVTNVYVNPIPYILYGVAAIIGHGFPLYLNFKGGKVVATSLGVILVTCPIAAIACLIVFLVTLKLSGYVSLSSTLATLTVLVIAWVFYGVGVEPTNFGEYFIGKQELLTCIFISLVAALIVIKHRKNYVRLFNGTENSFKKKKESK